MTGSTPHRGAPPHLGEIDLLAYADGFLDGDPVRRKAVEAYLETRPDEAARLQAYAEQNEEIRREFAHVLEAPVPDRLLRLVEEPAPRRAGPRPVWRMAAALALMATGGIAGWVGGRMVDPPRSELAAFVDRAVTGYGMPADTLQSPFTIASAGGDLPGGDLPGGNLPLGWLSQQVSVNVQVPDLTELGFRPVDKRLMTSDGSRAVRIEFAGDGGERLVMFLGTRWRDGRPEVTVVEQDGLAVAYWQDGPLVYGLVSDAGRGQVDYLAAMVAAGQQDAIDTALEDGPAMHDLQMLGVGEHARERLGAGDAPPVLPDRPGAGAIEVMVPQHN